MIQERYMPLRKAARQLGVHAKTLRRWLELDCGLVFPTSRRGSSPLVSEQDIQTVIAKRTGKRKWSRSEYQTRGGGQLNAAIYARVSTSNNGQDPTMQTREMGEFCERRGWARFEYVDRDFRGKGKEAGSGPTHGRRT